jgi:hypothetical protein
VVALDPQLSANDVEAAVRAVRTVEIERLSFLRPAPLWVAIQRTAVFGPSAVGGFKAAAKVHVAAAMGDAPPAGVANGGKKK